MFRATITRTIEASHSNGPPGHKCHKMHGHSFGVAVTVAYQEGELNEFGWGPEFSKIKEAIDYFDHQNLNERMDKAPSVEHLAEAIALGVETNTGNKPISVEIEEGRGNAVVWTPF